MTENYKTDLLSSLIGSATIRHFRLVNLRFDFAIEELRYFSCILSTSSKKTDMIPVSDQLLLQ